MPLSLLNGNLALTDIKPLSGNEKVKQGIVGARSAGITSINVGDTVFYPSGRGLEVTYNGKEYVVINQTDALGKI